MSRTYGVVNVLSSFGFCVRWRRQCVAQVGIRPGDRVYDLMSGMGELWPGIARRLQAQGSIHAVDFSRVMCERSRPTAARLNGVGVEVLEEDVLQNSIPDGSADVVVSSFGLKTFTTGQRELLARQLARILRPGGRFSFLEISVPPAAILRWPFMAYLHYLVPLLGRLLLGNPDNYRMLGVYTAAYGDCGEFARLCADAGLNVTPRRFFFGCATGVVGEKPSER
jgi:demethylmenaquinone methyltransferase/2-methoxy-6-polyprenyl-1,4-benzoquinol methylase